MRSDSSRVFLWTAASPSFRSADLAAGAVFNQHAVHDGRLLGRILEPKVLRLVLDAFVELQNVPDDVCDRTAERSRLPFVVAPTAHADLLRKLLFQVFGDCWQHSFHDSTASG